jgi:hypothetical protein
MQEDEEISWHRSQIVKHRELVEELLAGNTEGSDIFLKRKLRSIV